MEWRVELKLSASTTASQPLQSHDDPLCAADAAAANAALAVATNPQTGLDERRSALAPGKVRPNAMPDTTSHPMRMALENSGPRPVDARGRDPPAAAIGEYLEAAVIAALLYSMRDLAVSGEPRPGHPCPG